MTEIPPESSKEILDRPPVGNLTDFVTGVDENNPLSIEVAVDEKGKVIVFYNKPFRTEISWFEYDLTESKLDFILEGGEVRDAGMKLAPIIAKNMQNSHQILIVLMDDKTGEAEEGQYIPLIVHRN